MLNDTAHFFKVGVIDTGDHDRIDLNQYALLYQHIQTLLLLLDQDLGTFLTFNATIVPVDPRIDLSTYLGVHGINGDGHVIDIMLSQFFNGSGERQTVGGHTQFDIRCLLT